MTIEDSPRFVIMRGWVLCSPVGSYRKPPFFAGSPCQQQSRLGFSGLNLRTTTNSPVVIDQPEAPHSLDKENGGAYAEIATIGCGGPLSASGGLVIVRFRAVALQYVLPRCAAACVALGGVT